LRSGNIKDNGSDAIPVLRKGVELRVIEEGHYRAFDLIIAEIASTREHIHHSMVSNILTRTALYYDIAIAQKCQIDRLRLFPVELKSDADVIDSRLARQVAHALFTFGNSIVVLDQKHSKKMKSSAFCKALPATVIARTSASEFEIVSTFSPRTASSVLEFNKTSLARLLSDNGEISSDRLARRLDLLQLVIQKLAFSQLYSENVSLDSSELEFLRQVVNCDLFSKRELVRALSKKTANSKLTDYVADP